MEKAQAGLEGLGPTDQDGQMVTLKGERFYRFSNYDRLRPFLLTLVSPADHWLFISSTGALTAGRGNPDQALFPYYTEDKIHDSAELTGSKTVLRVQSREGARLWEPFSRFGERQYRLERNLYKQLRGNKLIFEEFNHDLGLVFRYGWFLSERFGFVRQAWLRNIAASSLKVEVLDGIQNLMPSGIDSRFQLEKSVLLDAYKRSELLPQTGLALVRLSSIPLDRPEPAEALRTTTVWSLGLEPSRKLLCSRQLECFRKGLPLHQETDIRAERGAYFLQAILTLRPHQTRDWFIVADINQTASDVAALNLLLRGGGRELRSAEQPVGEAHTKRHVTLPLRQLIQNDIAQGTKELEQLVAKADGLQATARRLGDARHYSNVLFNIMRGGVFETGYDIEVADLQRFIGQANRQTAARHKKFFKRLTELARAAGSRKPARGLQSAATHPRPSGLDSQPSLLEQRVIAPAAPAPRPSAPYAEVVGLAARTGDPDLERLCREYLPLSFSRRHGDPSRPWNRFNIAPKLPDGSRSLHYEGNWRDLFQNWEALSVSFPGYLAGMICRFVNASTTDGYNPYRLTQAGIDWEVPDPNDPWAHIGYWGDHQVSYLTKLLEHLHHHNPGELGLLLRREIFAYANVPYRLKPYRRLLADPKQTVTFDAATQALVDRRVEQCGADGKLIWDRQGRVHVTLTEKLLVPILAKLSNFIPEAGIWLNTQRPEWNDANNALVGHGASMVTLYYLRRHLLLCSQLLSSLGASPIRLSREVARFLTELHRVLERNAIPGKPTRAETQASATRRRTVLDQLGEAGSRYRHQLYQHGFSGAKVPMRPSTLAAFLTRAIEWVEVSIRSNRRPDSLYHAYNLVGFTKPGAVTLRRLYEMLEGQVAVLSSGCLSAQESLEVLRALRRSAMYRANQHTYLLYPDRRLPGFLEKNIIPAKSAGASRLLQRLHQERNSSIAERDCMGHWHFNSSFKNAADLRHALESLEHEGYKTLVKKERPALLDLFERVFDHQSFTGRSGTFFGYEGLGCIYWHMVSKLLLAVRETFFRAAGAGAQGNGVLPANTAALRELAAFYWDIRSGLGDGKTPVEYGAFPMDPYSHTPAQGGARQPGLTGQVKEDFLCRMGELGVTVVEGTIHFRPWLLRRKEFLKQPAEFEYYDVSGAARKLSIPANGLAFTYCQVPIVYQLTQQPSLTVSFADGTCDSGRRLSLDAETSQTIFERSGQIAKVSVGIPLSEM